MRVTLEPPPAAIHTEAMTRREWIELAVAASAAAVAAAVGRTLSGAFPPQRIERGCFSCGLAGSLSAKTPRFLTLLARRRAS